MCECRFLVGAGQMHVFFWGWWGVKRKGKLFALQNLGIPVNFEIGANCRHKPNGVTRVSLSLGLNCFDPAAINVRGSVERGWRSVVSIRVRSALSCDCSTGPRMPNNKIWFDVGHR